MNRRRFLVLASSGGMGAAAGCLSFGGDAHATLQRLDLINQRSDPVTVEVRIEREDTDEVAYLEPHEILTDPNMVTLDCVWPDAPVTVMVRQMDGNWNRLTTAEYDGCLGVIAEIGNDRPSFVTHTAECPIRTAACHTDVVE